jgi:hypothetical protein
MKTFIILTSATIATEYTVEANSIEEAETKYWDGQYLTSRERDTYDENIEDVMEMVEETGKLETA